MNTSLNNRFSCNEILFSGCVYMCCILNKDFVVGSGCLLTEFQLDCHNLRLKIVFPSVSGERDSYSGEQRGCIYCERLSSRFVH